MNNPHVKYERRDIAARYVVYFAGISTVLAVLMHLGLHGLTTILVGTPVKGEHLVTIELSQFPKPRLQVDEAADLSEVQRQEESKLGSYGWIDRRERRVRIPIDRAMEVIIKKGQPDWSEKKEPMAEPIQSAPKPEAQK